MYQVIISNKEEQEEFFFENKEDAEKATKIASEDYCVNLVGISVISLEDFKDYYKNYC